jgi:DNA polymerase III subunit beta
VTTTSHATVHRSGTVAVPTREVTERVKVMPDGPIQLTTTDTTSLVLKAQGSKREFRLRGMSGDDFPALPTPDETAPIRQVSAEVLAGLISKTSFSISPDETRPHLNSALLEWSGTVSRMVTTDGHRLSLFELPVSALSEPMSLLVPQKGINELRRLCDELHSEKASESPILKLIHGGANLFFVRDDFVLAVKLVDATFPPYQQVIPKSVTHEIRVPRFALLDVLRAMSVAASDRTGSVRMAFSKQVLRVSSENPDYGEAVDELPIEFAGADIVIGFNVRYLIDVLTVLEDDEIRLGISGELDPVVLSPAQGPKFLGIVMPMRI